MEAEHGIAGLLPHIRNTHFEDVGMLVMPDRTNPDRIARFIEMARYHALLVGRELEAAHQVYKGQFVQRIGGCEGAGHAAIVPGGGCVIDSHVLIALAHRRAFALGVFQRSQRNWLQFGAGMVGRLEKQDTGFEIERQTQRTRFEPGYAEARASELSEARAAHVIAETFPRYD